MPLTITAQDNSNDFAFEVSVTGKGESVILIPGLLSGGDVWDELVNTLSPQYECHVLTFAGFAGVEPLSDGPYLSKWKQDILRYIVESGLTTVRLIGHSLGGFMSMWIGTENHPEIKQIAIVDALPFFALMMNPDAQTGFDEGAAKVYLESFAGLSEPELRNARMMTARGMVRDSTRYEQIVEWAMKSDLKTEAWSALEMMGKDLRDEIAAIDVPVLVLAAFAENPVFPQFTKEAVREMYASQYEKGKTVRLEVVEEAGHFIMFDQHEETFRLINEFFRE